MISEEELTEIEKWWRDQERRARRGPSGQLMPSALTNASGAVLHLVQEVRSQRATIERMTQAYAVLHARLAELTAEPPHDNRAEHADRIEALAMTFDEASEMAMVLHAETFMRLAEPLDVYDYKRGIPDCEDVV